MAESTSHLIDRLAGNLQPVRPLSPPWRRAIVWLVLLVALAATLLGLRGADKLPMLSTIDSSQRVIEMLAAAATGVLALVAAFHVGMPGRSWKWALLPLPTLAIWIANQCMGVAQQVHVHGTAFASTDLAAGLECAGTILLVGVPLALASLWLLRHAAAVRPVSTTMLAVLGNTALVAAVVSMIHGPETALMMAFSHVGLVIVLLLAARLFGRPLLRWLEAR